MTDIVDEEANDGFSDGIPYPVFKHTDSWHDVHICSEIQDTDRSQTLHMLEAYSDILTNIPVSTDATQHVITLLDNKSIVVHQYPIPLHYEDEVKKELIQLLKMNSVEFGIFHIPHQSFPF